MGAGSTAWKHGESMRCVAVAVPVVGTVETFKRRFQLRSRRDIAAALAGDLHQLRLADPLLRHAALPFAHFSLGVPMESGEWRGFPLRPMKSARFVSQCIR